MNLVEIIGFVGNDPEERMTPSGRKVVSFRIADNIKAGEREETIWWKVSCWGDQFDRMMPYIKKGSLLIVHGELRRKPETYQDREGRTQGSLLIVHGEFRRKPETYQDREGRTQVSLDITATQIRFAPGGKSDRSQGSEERPSSTPSYSQGGSPAPASVPGGFRPGTAADDFNEDNLPF